MELITFGNWKLEVSGEWIVIRNTHPSSGSMEYRFWRDSVGWVDFRNDKYEGTVYYDEAFVSRRSVSEEDNNND